MANDIVAKGNEPVLEEAPVVAGAKGKHPAFKEPLFNRVRENLISKPVAFFGAKPPQGVEKYCKKEQSGCLITNSAAITDIVVLPGLLEGKQDSQFLALGPQIKTGMTLLELHSFAMALYERYGPYYIPSREAGKAGKFYKNKETGKVPFDDVQLMVPANFKEKKFGTKLFDRAGTSLPVTKQDYANYFRLTDDASSQGVAFDGGDRNIQLSVNDRVRLYNESIYAIKHFLLAMYERGKVRAELILPQLDEKEIKITYDLTSAGMAQYNTTGNAPAGTASPQSVVQSPIGGSEAGSIQGGANNQKNTVLVNNTNTSGPTPQPNTHTSQSVAVIQEELLGKLKRNLSIMKYQWPSLVTKPDSKAKETQREDFALEIAKSAMVVPGLEQVSLESKKQWASELPFSAREKIATMAIRFLRTVNLNTDPNQDLEIKKMYLKRVVNICAAAARGPLELYSKGGFISQHPHQNELSAYSKVLLDDLNKDFPLPVRPAATGPSRTAARKK